MERRILGRTGVSVSKLCFGAGMFGYFGNSDPQACERMVHRALDAGINYFDTSDVYSHGESETILGKALKGRRDQVILATKFGLPMSDEPNHRGNSRRWILREVEASLQRLGTDYIDLYQVHRPDPGTDLDETLGALSDLVRAGAVPGGAAAVLHLRPAHRGRRPAGVPASRHGRGRLEPPGPGLAHRQVAA
jgi:aryl-alcohol dehydrogenase-like predicted oxidoreductase